MPRGKRYEEDEDEGTEYGRVVDSAPVVRICPECGADLEAGDDHDSDCETGNGDEDDEETDDE